jgi:hypothetical protein
MKILIGVLKELSGLFIEDLGYSIVIGLWIAVVALLLHQIPMNPIWRGPVLYFGIVFVLLENVTRAAQKKKR